ncbi:MAG: aminodeoxychorismate/anthranilate synthase component II [Candidatus Eremiobacteraeota bacterium]|nr:aminodeoxychorismate/anthranilate synthase component II [Candidatus Eremiobacteraeota bacterium]
MRLLFIDNFDSFTYNLVHLLAAHGAEMDVWLNDDVRMQPAALDAYDALAIGPGPGKPDDTPAVQLMVRAAAERELPLLGVCLGLQVIGATFGGTIAHAPQLMHGKTSFIRHDGTGVFAGLPSPFVATRYHSLCLAASSVPANLRITARSDDGVVQGLAHATLPIHAVQFHPESVLSEQGAQIARNFLTLAAARVRCD